MIVQRAGKWVVLSMSGATLGEYESRDDAAERLRQVEAAKAAQVRGGATAQDARQGVEKTLGFSMACRFFRGMSFFLLAKCAL